MIKEQYLQNREILLKEIAYYNAKGKDKLDKEKAHLQNLYLDRKALDEARIETGKLCCVGDVVEITLRSGRVVTGRVLGFHIYLGDVYIDSYQVRRKNNTFESAPRYIDTTHGAVKILKN